MEKTFSGQILCSCAFGANIRSYTKQKARHGTPFLHPPPPPSAGVHVTPPPPPPQSNFQVAKGEVGGGGQGEKGRERGRDLRLGPQTGGDSKVGEPSVRSRVETPFLTKQQAAGSTCKMAENQNSRGLPDVRQSTQAALVTIQCAAVAMRSRGLLILLPQSRAQTIQRYSRAQFESQMCQTPSRPVVLGAGGSSATEGRITVGSGGACPSMGGLRPPSTQGQRSTCHRSGTDHGGGGGSVQFRSPTSAAWAGGSRGGAGGGVKIVFGGFGGILEFRVPFGAF